MALDIGMTDEELREELLERAAHQYLDDLTKTVLAELMAESNEKTATAREEYARRHPRFAEHLKQLDGMRRQDLIGRRRDAAADAKIRIWQTLSANTRGMERVR
jgi:hypothetical protein